jgi:D-aspartate ligase
VKATGPGGRPTVVLGGLWAGLALTRALGRRGVPVAGISLHGSDFGIRSRYLRRRLVVEEADTARRDQQVLAELRRLAAGGRVVLVPERDEHVELALRHWDEVRALADMPLPDDPDATMRLRRKERLAEEAVRAEVPAPRTLLADSEATIRAADLRPPFLVKPVEGQDFALAFGRKVVVADTVDAAVVAWAEAADRGLGTILQELIPDSTERIHSLFTYIGRSGRPLADVVGRKVRQGPLGFGTAAVFEVQFDERVRDTGHRLLASTGYRGFAQVEFAYDRRDDAYKLLEVNTRMPQWAGLAMTRDFDIARIAHNDLSGLPEPPCRTLTADARWIFMAKDVWVSMQMARRGELGPSAFLAPYLRRPRVRAVFAVDDPLPAAASISYLRSRVA